jgi:hypothetical protein
MKDIMKNAKRYFAAGVAASMIGCTASNKKSVDMTDTYFSSIKPKEEVVLSDCKQNLIVLNNEELKSALELEPRLRLKKKNWNIDTYNPEKGDILKLMESSGKLDNAKICNLNGEEYVIYCNDKNNKSLITHVDLSEAKKNCDLKKSSDHKGYKKTSYVTDYSNVSQNDVSSDVIQEDSTNDISSYAKQTKQSFSPGFWSNLGKNLEFRIRGGQEKREEGFNYSFIGGDLGHKLLEKFLGGEVYGGVYAIEHLGDKPYTSKEENRQIPREIETIGNVTVETTDYKNQLTKEVLRGENGLYFAWRKDLGDKTVGITLYRGNLKKDISKNNSLDTRVISEENVDGEPITLSDEYVKGEPTEENYKENDITSSYCVDYDNGSRLGVKVCSRKIGKGDSQIALEFNYKLF